jgi:chromosome segregation ATPase
MTISEDVTNGNSISIEDQLEQMREETRLASQRAREAEDALAAEIIRRDAEINEDRACAADVSRLERELSRAKTSLTEAKFLERQAVTKSTRMTDELTETKTELQRLRGRLNALETQKKTRKRFIRNRRLVSRRSRA